MSGRLTPPRLRICDLDAIHEALVSASSTTVRLILCREGILSPLAKNLLEHARKLEIEISVESAREMRRMSDGEGDSELIALTGPSRETGLEELMTSIGLVFILVGLRYPGNVGFILRSAEVAGAAGVVLDSPWQGAEFKEALRVGMRADRFFPVIHSKAAVAIAAAREAGRRIVALETVGEKVLWNADLEAPIAVLVGCETTGIEAELLETADEILRIPTQGFIPSYNVQAVVSMVLGEWMRQGLAQASNRSTR
ncbi:MAG: TrmH family RNA methyltransferase [Myxococcota bacterium]